MGADTDTVLLPCIVGDSQLAGGVRLRLRIGGRQLLLDACRSSITIGRTEDNDVVVKDHLISRLHARIEISHNKFIVLLDQSRNGTVVQPAPGALLFIRRGTLRLNGCGMIGLGRPPEQDAPHTIGFRCEEIW